MKKALISWSGGKDSCYALQQAINKKIAPVALVSMMNERGTSTKSNGVSKEVLCLQAKSLGLPFECISTNWKDYEGRLLEVLIQSKNKYKAEYCIFGDIDIEGHRNFDEYISSKAGLKPIIPLWGYQRKNLAYKMLKSGIKAKISVVRKKIMPEKLLGADYDEDILTSLNDSNIDLLGENGEFHTLVYDSPLFKNKIKLIEDFKLEVADCKLLVYRPI